MSIDTGDPARCGICGGRLSGSDHRVEAPAATTNLIHVPPEFEDADGRVPVKGKLVIGFCEDCWFAYDVEGVLALDHVVTTGVDPETGEERHRVDPHVLELLGDVSARFVRQTGDDGNGGSA